MPKPPPLKGKAISGNHSGALVHSSAGWDHHGEDDARARAARLRAKGAAHEEPDLPISGGIGFRLPFNVMRVLLNELGQHMKDGEKMQEVECKVIEELAQDLQKLQQSFRDAISESNGVAVDTKVTELDVAVAEGQPVDLTDSMLTARPSSPSYMLTDNMNPQEETQVAMFACDAQAAEDLFCMLDSDGSGFIAREELKHALTAVKVPLARTTKLLHTADSDGNGQISKEEWLKAVSNQGAGEFAHCLFRIMKQNKEAMNEHVEGKAGRRPLFMLHPHSHRRLAWDLTIAVLLVYIATVLPYTISWGDEFNQKTKDRWAIIDWGVDIIFVMDLILNFRTGIIDNATSEEIMDWKQVGLHYLRGWFLMDFLSSVPFDRFTSFNAQMLKLAKIGKVVRILKLMRPATASNFQDSIADMMSSFAQRCSRRSGVFWMLCLLSHWLACALKLSDPEMLKEYQDVAGSGDREYLAALYWSMTTLTTVGYGDMIPTSDMGRGYCMVAMVIGGTFYGYVIGNISSIVANKDLNEAAYHERLDGVNAWLDFHRFPRQMRLKVRRHFQSFLSEQSAICEGDIFNDLSPTLREDLGKYLIKEEVTQNPLFDGLPIATVVRLQKILHTVSWEEHRAITVAGQSGTCMYLVISGEVTKTEPGQEPQTLGQGDSFGEEVLLGLTEKYAYTTMAETSVRMHMIEEEAFIDCFRTMPDVIEQMRVNAVDMQ